MKKIKKNRKRYKKNINGYRDSINDFCGTTMSAEEYFNHHLELDIENCNSLDYEEFKNGKYQTFNGRVEDFLYVKFTRDTPVTSGPVFEMCYFIINDIFKKLMSNINRLFEYPHYIEDIEFEDLTFYKGERIVLAICAHEQFAYLNLDYEEYKELVKLNISHEVEE